MAQQNRSAIKEYFQTGDIPTQQEYINLIDSYVTLTHEHNSGSITLSGSFDTVGVVLTRTNC